ncbi:MAG: protein-L-isoaspartate(D-aspartate) O-methyltransferase, partial [Opitutaceae bacterium]
MREVRRELFVPAAERSHAREDTALPIGWNQTISQPSLVARMTEELELTSNSRVLEIGTGSGYQTAILAELAGEVFTIERLLVLAAVAEARLRGLGYRNIHFRMGDGALGWPEESPFSAIIVTAAPEHMPPSWVEQLEPGGLLVAPVGSAAMDSQMLMLIEKDRDGFVLQRELCPVRFVPLVSDT